MPPHPLAALLAVLVLIASRAPAQDFGAWHAIGPFPHPQGTTDMEPPQPLERRLKAFAAGKEGPDFAEPVKFKEGVLRWVPIESGAERGRELDIGVIDFNTVLAPAGATGGWNANVVAYLYRRIDCASATELPVQMGSDDGVRLWLGGELLVDRGVPRALSVEDHQLVLRLTAGANHLFAKVVNQGGAWSFRMSPWKRIAQEPIDAAIDRGIEYLLGAQSLDGTWGSHPEYGAGHTSFTVYTLLKSGVPPEDPSILLALGAMEALPSEHTYSAACLVLALAATHDERCRPRIETAVQDLVDWQNGQDLYSYPIAPGHGTLPPDLSNTLYAALAFRAAEHMGIQVPERVWNDITEGTLRCVTKELALGANATGKSVRKAAGFSYRVGTNEPTGSMTTAGLSVLALAQEGTDGKMPPALAQRARNAIDLGLAWLDRNMFWDGNPGQGAHHYFWIYGVERAGSLLGLETLGGLDWYWSGAAYLVRKQADDGGWPTAGDEGAKAIDTLLALLFLERATVPITSAATPDPARRNPRQPATQERGERRKEWEAGNERDPLQIHARGESSTVLWTSALRDDLRDALSGPKGIEVVELEFLGDCTEDEEDEVVLGTVSGRFVTAEELARLELPHVFARPGTWSIRGRLHVMVRGTQPRVVETPILSLKVSHVFDRRRLEYVHDPDRSLLRGLEAKLEASSSAGRAREAIDGRYASAWECDAKDAKPWIRITPPRPIQAERLSLAQALNRGRDSAKPRALEVEVVLNGEVKLRVTMEADNRIKGGVDLPPRTPVRTLELRILSLRDGKLGAAAAGFSEIELFGAR